MDDLLDWRLLLVIAVFGVGWAIARVDMDQVVSKARVVPGLIMEGIGSLLRGQRLEAARAFLAAGQPLGPENAELHFAAGELFRIQGGYEEAIRVHKVLLAAEGLDEETRARARFELGLDYQKGGFLDLAEQCFGRLEGTAHADESLRHLFNIHLYSRDWERAVADEERFAKDDISSELRRHVIAQLYCEWASEAAG
ncbi:MAG: lipopolysaccharide assembly protein LapB, partial [Betaproteobacteria bacterium AqS2]|nr:lipopolysaccharide assembly protein LapB [Betaproteobacteria bacterium AqS2]